MDTVDDWQVTPRDGFYRHLWEEVPLFEASAFDCFVAYSSCGCSHHGLVLGRGSLSTNPLDISSSLLSCGGFVVQWRFVFLGCWCC